MSATKREQIMAALKTTLAGTTGVGTRIYRSRQEPISRGESPALILEVISDDPRITSSFDKLDWTLRIRVTVVARGANPETIADPTIKSVHSKLLADPSIGGLAMDMRPSTTSFQVLEADQPAVVVFCEYEVEYRTSLTNLSS